MPIHGQVNQGWFDTLRHASKTLDHHEARDKLLKSLNNLTATTMLMNQSLHLIVMDFATLIQEENAEI